MIIALIFVLFTLFVIALNYYSISNQFWFPELASNWGTMDTATLVTLIVSGVVFIFISLFVCYCLIRYRHRDNHRAEYEIENNKLENFLIVFTTLGVIALLAPGLVVYSDFVNAPDNAQKVEAIGEQWTWSFRFPGEDQIFGKTHPKHFSASNSFGIDPDDSYGMDDILIKSNSLHLPIGEPIDLSLRSKDVLHDFYVPQFRAKMDIVPGQLTKLWFTPTAVGEFEILCAEYCGVQHYNMRGTVIVEPEEDYKKWLSKQVIFANNRSEKKVTDLLVGKDNAQSLGCIACHSLDGSVGVGPSWKGIAGTTRKLNNGEKILADHSYLEDSITQPNDKVLAGYPPIMPSYDLTHQELDEIVEFIESLN